jgi:tripartite ATP-independent transporter DctM subunit
VAWYWVATLLFGTALGLMLLGVPVAVGFFVTNVMAAALFMGGAAGIQQVINNGFGAMTNFALVPIPMFLLMGELFYHTGLATRCFNAADKLLGNIRGRLAYVTLIGGTAYAGPAGSSMGACALLGRLMAPEMIRRGYSKYLSIGPIMGVGGLAVIIPPSALTVLLATLGQTDVGALLIAGIIPGLVLALMYGVLIWAWILIDPSAAPAYQVDETPRQEKIRLIFVDVIPMVAIIVFSVLIMTVGWCTPTEAAALGAVSVIVLAACYGDMTWQSFVKSMDGALRVTVMAFLVIFGSATFAQVLAFTGASTGLVNWALSFQFAPLGVVFVMIGVIIFLGSFMDPLSKMLLTAPIFFPLAKTLGFDLTWFGLIMLLALEMGYTMPPFGLLLFVMKGVSPPGTTMRDIYLAGMPFIGCVMILILVIIFFPPLATWLPSVSH